MGLGVHIAFGGALPFYDSPCSLYSSSHGPFPPTLSTFVTPVFLQCQCHQAFLLALQRWGQWREGSVTLGPGTFSLMLSRSNITHGMVISLLKSTLFGLHKRFGVVLFPPCPVPWPSLPSLTRLYSKATGIDTGRQKNVSGPAGLHSSGRSWGREGMEVSAVQGDGSCVATKGEISLDPCPQVT